MAGEQEEGVCVATSCERGNLISRIFSFNFGGGGEGVFKVFF